MDDRVVTFVACLEQWRSSIVPNSVDVRPVLEQDFNDMVVTHLTSDPKRRGAIVSRNISVSSSCQQHQQDRSMAVLCGDKKWRCSILFGEEMTGNVFLTVLNSTHELVTSRSWFIYSTSTAQSVVLLNFTFIKALTLAPAVSSSFTMFACPP